MKFAEIQALGQCPIICTGGAFGLVTRWDTAQDRIGVQVPGVDQLRWVAAEWVEDRGDGALVEIATPKSQPLPPLPPRTDTWIDVTDIRDTSGFRHMMKIRED